MEQLSKEEAIKLYKSKEWENWPDHIITGFQLFQKKLCFPFNIFHEAIEKTLNRPVYTHEFGLSIDRLIAEYLGKQSKPNFEDIINLIPKEKQLIIIK